MSRYVFLDLETTGLDPYVDEITEIGYVFDDGSRRQYFVEHTRLPTQYVLTKMDYLARILPAPKVPLEHALNILKFDCERASGTNDRVYLVGANPAFDHGFLTHAYRKLRINVPYHFRLIDIEAYVAGRLRLSDPPSLAKLRRLLGIDGENPHPHSAMSDAEEVKIAWDRLQTDYAS